MVSKLILIVEDEVDQRESLYELLTEAGHQVATAATGRQALDHIVSERPALVLADLALPDMNGRELLRRIRLIFSEPPPVVFITGNNRSQTEDITAEVLLKPFNIEKLLNLVSYHTGQHASTIFDTRV